MRPEPDRICLTANGVEFSALAWGEEGRPLALLVHGFPDTAWTWRHLGPRLAEVGWRVVAPFTRGYGPTSLAPDDRYFVADQAADLLALEAELGVGGSVLVGHDWGAVAAWEISSSRPGTFGSIVAMSVPPPAVLLDVWRSIGTVPIGLKQLRMSWYFLYNQLDGVAERGLEGLVRKLWRDWSPGYRAEEEGDLDHLFESLAGSGRRRASLKYYRDNLRRGIADLARIRPRVPVLYLHGVDDGCAQIALGESAAPDLPEGSRFVPVAGVGHFLQLEDPEKVGGLVSDWLGTPGGAHV